MNRANVLFGDKETRSAVDLKKSGALVYAKSDTTELLCFSYALGDAPIKTWKRGDAAPTEVFEALKQHKFCAHNAAFELAIWNHHCVPKLGWPPLSPANTVCTMAACYAMALPASLEKASAALGIEGGKDMSGHRVMMQLSQPRDILPDGTPVWWEPSDVPEKFEKLYAYCEQDVATEREIYKRVMPLSPAETFLWCLDQTINNRGVQVDLKAVKAAMALAEIEKKRLDQEMERVTGGAVGTCTATGQLSDWLKQKGVENFEGVAKTDVTELLGRSDLPEECRRALLLRQEAAKSSVAKLSAMAASSCPDGRIRGLFQYHGAGTGRWAGRRIQPQNFPRPKLSQEEIEDVFGVLRSVRCQ